MDDDRRFGGLVRLYGEKGSQAIRNAHVAVVGVGGVGSWAAEALVRSGVGAITLIDFDQVAESNINRQIHALDETLGMAKVDALQKRFAQINPNCKVYAVEEFVEPQTQEQASNWPGILSHQPQAQLHALIDACDQVRAKALLASWAVHQKIPFITIGAAGGKELAQHVEVADLHEVTHDPLLAQLRYRLRREYNFPRDGKMKVRCVFSRENVKQPKSEDRCEVDGSLNCHGYGSAVAVTATFGMVAAGQVLYDLAHKA